MIINGQSLFIKEPIRNMESTKLREHGVSYGLSEAGYDIRLKQTIEFYHCHIIGDFRTRVDGEVQPRGRFVIASAIEEFQMPNDLVGVVHDKSTWARKGLSVFNTVVEPGWFGFLTLELVYHGQDYLILPAGAGIAQVLFTQIGETAAYGGKYQNQENRPVQARFETSHGQLMSS